MVADASKDLNTALDWLRSATQPSHAVKYYNNKRCNLPAKVGKLNGEQPPPHLSSEKSDTTGAIRQYSESSLRKSAYLVARGCYNVLCESHHWSSELEKPQP